MQFWTPKLVHNVQFLHLQLFLDLLYLIYFFLKNFVILQKILNFSEIYFLIIQIFNFIL